jgi:hypothetical protein
VGHQAGDLVLHRPAAGARAVGVRRRVDIGRLGLDGRRLRVITGLADVGQRGFIGVSHQDVHTVLLRHHAEGAQVLAAHADELAHPDAPRSRKRQVRIMTPSVAAWRSDVGTHTAPAACTFT